MFAKISFLLFRSARKVGGGEQDKVVSDQDVASVLKDFFGSLLEGTNSANNDTDTMYKEMFTRQQGCPEICEKNLTLMHDKLGYSIMREKSIVPGAGTGVIVHRGCVKQGSVVAMYPGE